MYFHLWKKLYTVSSTMRKFLRSDVMEFVIVFSVVVSFAETDFRTSLDTVQTMALLS